MISTHMFQAISWGAPIYPISLRPFMWPTSISYQVPGAAKQPMPPWAAKWMANAPAESSALETPQAWHSVEASVAAARPEQEHWWHPISNAIARES